MSNKRNRKPRSGKSNWKTDKSKGKMVEENVPDSDINAADLGPMERRNRKSKANGNDPSWYNHYPELVRNVTGVNFGSPLGSLLQELPSTSIPEVGKRIQVYESVPGIMTIHFIPTYGDMSAGENSPINKIGIQLYAAMRRELGSTAKYESPDICQYLIAMDSMFMLYALGVKIYGCLQMSSPFNYYLMQNLAASMNVDWNSFRVNMSNFRSILNQFAIYGSSRLVPSVFDIFRRHLWMLQNIFTDSSNVKAQMYHYMLDGIYIYREQVEGPAFNQYTPLIPASSTLLTFERFQTLISEVQSVLFYSSDIDQMSSDIGKAFSDSLFILNLVPEDYQTPITYSAEVLTQIENATLVGNPFSKVFTGQDVINMDITQKIALDGHGPYLEQSIFTVPKFVNKDGSTINITNSDTIASMYLNSHLLNMHHADISADDIMVATRASIVGKSVQALDNGKSQEVGALEIGPRGTEIYTYAVMYSMAPGGNLSSNAFVTHQYVDSMASVITTASLHSVFDWAPYCVLHYLNGSTPNQNDTFGRLQDVDMYAEVDSIQLKAMHETAVLSEFYSDKFPNAHLR